MQFAQTRSRKRPFTALSPTQCRHTSSNHDFAPHSRGSHLSTSRSVYKPSAHIRAVTLDTAEAASDSVEAKHVHPEPIPQSNQQQRFDWHDQWYAVGYEM